MKQLSLDIITSELGIGKDSFYNHLKAMEDMKFISVNHKGWTMTDEVESNEYYFKGIR